MYKAIIKGIGRSGMDVEAGPTDSRDEASRLARAIIEAHGMTGGGSQRHVVERVIIERVEDEDEDEKE